MPYQLRSDAFSPRSTAMAGLRSIVSYAFQNSIDKLTVPLLMVPRFVPEEMHQRWCLRRSELVLKSTKGQQRQTH